MKHASPNPTYYVQPREFGCKSLSSEDIKHYEGLKAAGYLTKSPGFLQFFSFFGFPNVL